MPAKKDFTDRSLRTIKPTEAGKRLIIYDAAVPGLGIRISDKSCPESIGTFVLVSRFPGSTNPTARRIGEFPATGLAKAREIARQWREDIRQGVDPKVKEKARQREEARLRADTFKVAFEAYADDHLTTLRTGQRIQTTIKAKLYPTWSDRPMSSLKRADVLEVIRTERKAAPVGANRLLAYLRHFFSWAVNQDLIEASPAATVKKPAKESSRDRVLTEAEIKAIWHACASLGAFGRAFRFMLLTGQRRGEVAAMTWSEADLNARMWRMTGDRTKNGRSHEVPLSDAALAILEGSPRLSDYVFCSGRSARATNGGGATAISGFGKSKEALDAAALVDGRPLAEWHLHDLRRTAATYMAKLGTDRTTVGKVLNHSEPGITAVYDRHSYDVQKRRAVEMWADYLAAIVGDPNGSNIIAFQARAS